MVCLAVTFYCALAGGFSWAGRSSKRCELPFDRSIAFAHRHASRSLAWLANAGGDESVCWQRVCALSRLPGHMCQGPACLTVHSAAIQMVGSNRTYGPTMPAEPGDGNDKKKDD